MTDLHTPRHWRYRLLGVLDIPTSTENLRFLQAWFQAEGGSAQYNPLNSSYPMPFAGSWNYNNIGVKNYRDALTGICATALTLMQPTGDFTAIVAALKSTVTAEQMVGSCRSELRVWGTNPDTILAVLKEI